MFRLRRFLHSHKYSRCLLQQFIIFSERGRFMIFFITRRKLFENYFLFCVSKCVVYSKYEHVWNDRSRVIIINYFNKNFQGELINNINYRSREHSGAVIKNIRCRYNIPPLLNQRTLFPLFVSQQNVSSS